MDASTLIAGNALPWCLGIAFLLAFPRRSTAGGAGEVAWIAGAGYLVGAFLLTVWMRVLSLVGGKFAVLPIVAPLAALTGVLLWLAWRRAPGDAAAALRAAWHALLRSPGLEGAARAAWWGALAWLAIRFTLLAVEVATRPLYPWDAWTQWATKARVWYELGGIESRQGLQAQVHGEAAVQGRPAAGEPFHGRHGGAAQDDDEGSIDGMPFQRRVDGRGHLGQAPWAIRKVLELVEHDGQRPTLANPPQQVRYRPPRRVVLRAEI